MAQPESRISGGILEALKARGIFAFKVHGGPNQMTGIPDILACVEGRFVGFEVKMPDKRDNTSARQKIVMNLINECRGVAVVVCGVLEAMEIVDELVMRHRINNPVPGLDQDTQPIIEQLEKVRDHRRAGTPHGSGPKAEGRRIGEVAGLNLAIRLLRGERL